MDFGHIQVLRIHAPKSENWGGDGYGRGHSPQPVRVFGSSLSGVRGRILAAKAFW